MKLLSHWARLVVLVGFSCLFGPSCSETGEVWPSYAVEVPINSSGPAPVEVSNAVKAVLIPRGYKDLGKNGYDEIKGANTSVNLGLGEGIVVGIGLDRSDHVPIRLSYNGERYEAQCKADFEALQADLQSKWPTTRLVR